MEEFHKRLKSEMTKEYENHESPMEEASRLARLKIQLPLVLAELNQFVTDEEYSGVPEEPEKRAEVRINFIYKNINNILEYMKNYSENIDFKLLADFKVHELLLHVLANDATPMLYYKILLVFSYYWDNIEGREILANSEFVDFFVAQIGEEVLPADVPLILCGIQNLMPSVPAIKAKFLEVDAHEYVSNMVKIAVKENDKILNREEDGEEENDEIIDNPLLIPVFSSDDYDETLIEAANLMDYIMCTFKQEDFDISKIFPFVKELFETTNPYAIIRLFHGLRILIFRYRILYPKMNEFAFDFESLGILTNRKMPSDDLFMEAFLFICALCYDCPFACSQYINGAFFDKITRNFQETSKTLELSLFNLNVLVQQTPDVTKQFVQSTLFDVVAELFQHNFFPNRLNALMVLINILRISDDEEVINTVLGTGVVDAFEIMRDVDEVQPQMEFINCLKHLIDFSQKNERREIIDLILEREWIGEILQEYTESEYDAVSESAQLLYDEISSLSE